jgi:hypothetical protein
VTLRVGSLRRTDLVAIGGIADIARTIAVPRSDVNVAESHIDAVMTASRARGGRRKVKSWET